MEDGWFKEGLIMISGWDRWLYDNRIKKRRKTSIRLSAQNKLY